MSRGAEGGGASEDKKKMAPLWWLKCARSALNQLSATEKGRVPNLSDDGTDCGSGGGVGDEDALDHPALPYAVQQREKKEMENAIALMELETTSQETTAKSKIEKVKMLKQENEKEEHGLLKMLLMEMSSEMKKTWSKKRPDVDADDVDAAAAARHLAELHCFHYGCDEGSGSSDMEKDEEKSIVLSLLDMSNQHEELRLMMLSVSNLLLKK